MTNQQLQDKLGKATEKLVCKTLKKYGYWAYNMPKKVNGQPCDIIAVKGLEGTIITSTMVYTSKTFLVWLVDAKHIRKEDVSFTFDRIESNQITSMRYARDFSNIDNLGFAIFFDRDKQLRWLWFEDYEKLAKSGIKSVNMHNLALFTEVLENADNNQ